MSATNGSPSGLTIPSYGGLYSDSSGEAPLNLSLKPTTTTSHTSSSLNSLSNMSANIGVDKICKPLKSYIECKISNWLIFIARRKPGPKPRRVIPSSSSSSSQLPPGAPSASLVQLFATADSPKTSSGRAENSTSPSTVTSTAGTTIPSISSMNHKDGRPRNLGRGVSKPKKNTVASLLAQSRALGNHSPIKISNF